MSQLFVDNIKNRTGGAIGAPAGAVVTGIVTATGGSFSGNVSVGGVLTYEDVTNIDSVGIVTASTGIKVLAGGINAVGVVTATGVNATGVVTATSFVGSGASLTNLPASGDSNDITACLFI